jgi:hypothetical protein
VKTGVKKEKKKDRGQNEKGKKEKKLCKFKYVSIQ